MSEFTGFGTETRKFLRGLGKNNDKAWFEAHRAQYDAYYIEPAKAFVEAVGLKVEKFAPNISFEPRVNGSIFRVNRDIRFSKDKTPYKDHIDLWLWEGQRKTALSGFFLRIRHDRIYLGAGSHGFDKEALSRFREQMNYEKKAKALTSLLKRAERAGFSISGRHYKKPPRGFNGNAAGADLVLYAGLSASVERKRPPELGTAKFTTYCAREWKKLAPLHRWLMAEVGAR
ncbi:MAG: DUF2461 domain-containing protein [Myxococcota bacterium]